MSRKEKNVPVVVINEPEERELSEVEIYILKQEAKAQGLAHIDGKLSLLNYVFPMMRRLAKANGDHAVDIGNIIEAMKEVGEGGGAGVDGETVELIEDARDLIIEIASMLDEAMVAGGLYIVVPDVGLKASDKVPQEMREKYEALGKKVGDLLLDMKDELDSLTADADADGDGATLRNDDDDDDGPSLEGVPVLGDVPPAVASPLAPTPTAPTPTTPTPTTTESALGPEGASNGTP